MRRALGVGVMLAAVALAALYAFGGRRDAGRTPSDGPDGGQRGFDDPGFRYASHSTTGRTQPSVAVQTIDVPPESQGPATRLSGIAKGAHDVAIAPKVPARIVALFVRNGSAVTRGGRLALLDMGDLEAQLDAARAGVAAARAVVGKALRGKAARGAELEAARLTAEAQLRVAELKLREAELGTPLAASSALADVDRSAAGVRQAEAGVKQAEIGSREADDAVRRLELLHRHGGVADIELSGARSKAAMAHAALDMARAALELARAGERPAAEAAPVRDRLGKAQLEAARTGVEMAKEGVRIADRARNEALAIADRDIEAARAQLDQAQAGLRQATAAIGTDILTSPVEGVVTRLTGQVGEYAQPGFAIMRVVSPDVARIEAATPIRLAARLRVGMRATIYAGDGPPPGFRYASHSTTVAGWVSAIGRVAEPGGRTVPVTLELARPIGAARPGAHVTIELNGSGVEGLVLPADAVKRDAAGLHVFVVSHGRAIRTAVVAGVRPDGRWAVRSGLAAGDRVICPVADGIVGGARVREATP